MSGRTVIVTGASSGIGEATARAFGRAGDRVVLAARRVERLNSLAAELPDSLVVPADLTKREDVTRVAEATLARYGTIDVLVNNAGLWRYDWLERLSGDDILVQLGTNLTAPILLTQAVLPAMQTQGRGVIINVCSVAGKIGVPTLSIYNATKFGLDGFSEAMRRELRPQGIHVCVVYPGGVAGTESSAHTRGATIGATTPPWLRQTADGVAQVIVGLADRPSARRVLPGIFGAAIVLNALLPSVVDRVLMRVARRARGRSPGVH